jgi:hypothetical protein
VQEGTVELAVGIVYLKGLMIRLRFDRHVMVENDQDQISGVFVGPTLHAQVMFTGRWLPSRRPSLSLQVPVLYKSSISPTPGPQG